MAIAPTGARAAPVADEARLARIQQLIESGDLRGARGEVLNALKILPGDPRLHNFLGVIDAQRQDFGSAEASFRRAIDIAPRFTGAYLNLGRLYQEHASAHDGAPAKALNVYRNLLQFDPDNVEARYQSALLLNRLGEFGPSLGELARLPVPAQHRVAALALRCANHAALGNGSQAASSGRELLAAADLTEADVLPIVPVLHEHRQRDLATALLEELAHRGLSSPAALNHLAILYEERGQWREARETLEKELHILGRPSAELLIHLGKTAYQAGDLEGALGYLAHARDLEPGNALIHYLFGLICIDLKLPPEAKQSLTEAVRLDSNNPYHNYALGAVLLQAKKPEEAIPHFQKFRERRPDDPRGSFALGVAYFDAYQMDAARRELESAAAHTETRAGAHLYLGRLAIRENKLEEAAGHLRRAVQASPSEPQPYAELGLVQIRRQEYELAGKTLSQAVLIAPDHYQANLNLLMLYQRTKDPRAAEQARRVARLQTSNEERERMLLRSLEIRPY